MTDIQDTTEALVRQRAVRIFTYLKEQALLRSKVVRDLNEYDETIWFHQVPEYKGCFSVLSAESPERPDGVWLEIRKPPREPQRPPIPASCLKWLDDSPEADPLAEPRLKKEIPRDNAPSPDASLGPLFETSAAAGRPDRLADHPEVQKAWRDYIQHDWLPWSKSLASWQKANDLYYRLFSVYEQLKKLGERYELVLALGLLTWQMPNGQLIKRHIVVGDANLNFDADHARFELVGAPEGTRLHFETEMVDLNYLPAASQQKQIEDMLASVQESPWEKEEIAKILRSWIQSLSPDGTYSDSLVPPDRCTTSPTLTLAPAMTLRRRTERSQVQCFSSIAEQIRAGGRIPGGVQLLCQISESAGGASDDQDSADAEKPGDHVLYLPLPTNEEQLQIMDQIRYRRGLLVQGPPGTGKSHTIANLVCHLLAQGKRVLVTSETPRALRVLKDKIPQEVAALCVTLLGNDQAAREELKNSVQTINQKHSEWNPHAGQTNANSLRLALFETQKFKADTARLLREQREIETYEYQVGGGTYKGTAEAIARRVREEEDRFSWLADDIDHRLPCPLSGAEFVELVRLLRTMPATYCAELGQEVVSRTDLPDVAHFVKMIDTEKAAQRGLEAHASRRQSALFSTLARIPEEDLLTLSTAISGLLESTGSLQSRFAWVPGATADMLSGNDTPWKELHRFMKLHLAGLRDKATIAQALDVEIPASFNMKGLRADANELLEHLRAGGHQGWGFLAPQVVKRTRYIADQVRVNGRSCTTIESLSQLAAYLDSMDEIDLLWSALSGKDRREEGSVLVQVGYLEERLEALEAVAGLESHLRSEEHTSSPRSHPLNQELALALERRDAAAVAECLDRLEKLEEDRQRLQERARLEARLSQAAPALAGQIRSTTADAVWDHRARDFAAAWAWKQADRWLAGFHQEHDSARLETELQKLANEERKTISQLAAAKAWESCFRSLKEQQRASLTAWAATMKKIGKGTGKYAPVYRRQAQQYMDECKEAIPAWIMPLYRVFETVSPTPEAFDVIIVDEASQTGPEGLAVLYLAKQCIIVGDSEQISPDPVGIDQSTVGLLINKHLEGVPFMDQYDPQTSLFTHAEILFPGRIVLREHFRCMPEIIQFSNDLCYSASPLKPLRQYPPERLEPIVVHRVENGFREGSGGRALNRPEADALVDAMVELCALPRYAGKTMGVISLQGEDQARYIQSKLLTRLSPAELEARRIVCGDAYAFQGDERDVIFLSMVAAPNERIGALVRETDKRRFNVAASRARDQLVLFHTASLNDLHPECMRHRLLKYCLHPALAVHEADIARCESQFEKDVYQTVAGKGYRAIPQYEVAGYRIDLVVEGIKSRLAVECDGDEWHGMEQYESDVARQRILERSGWRFWRIRGFEYYRDPRGALEPLWKLLDQTGINPSSST
ncbi:MAG: AAA domain-containing protein [Chloroflexi bacterium]|nr:AAA domain-containing protein [Chloroflexota bacterium]